MHEPVHLQQVSGPFTGSTLPLCNGSQGCKENKCLLLGPLSHTFQLHSKVCRTRMQEPSCHCSGSGSQYLHQGLGKCPVGAGGRGAAGQKGTEPFTNTMASVRHAAIPRTECRRCWASEAWRAAERLRLVSRFPPPLCQPVSPVTHDRRRVARLSSLSEEDGFVLFKLPMTGGW